MKPKSLLEIAKSSVPPKTRTIATKEEIDLALAWARQEISYQQACIALKGKRGMFLCSTSDILSSIYSE